MPDFCPEGCYWQCEHRLVAISAPELAFAHRTGDTRVPKSVGEAMESLISKQLWRAKSQGQHEQRLR